MQLLFKLLYAHRYIGLNTGQLTSRPGHTLLGGDGTKYF